MTITKAHQVIARWRRLLIPLGTHAEATAAAKMEMCLWGGSGGGVLLLIVSAALGSKSELNSAIVLYATLQTIGSVFILKRIIAARGVLANLPIANLQS